MNELIHGRPYELTSHGPRFRPCVPNGVLARLGDKWTILVMSHLAVAAGHRLRFSALKNGIEGITQRMLTLTVRNLERDGLLARHYFPEVPPRVEYELTEMGANMLPALEGFTSWIRENWPQIAELAPPMIRRGNEWGISGSRILNRSPNISRPSPRMCVAS